MVDSLIDRFSTRECQRPSIAEPTRDPVVIEPSPEGSDDISRLLGVAVFNGICGLLTVLSRRGLISGSELTELDREMTAPLDDAEWRDDELITVFRDTLISVLAQARAQRRDLGSLFRDPSS